MRDTNPITAYEINEWHWSGYIGTFAILVETQRILRQEE
jgi:hypothetical protein